MRVLIAPAVTMTLAAAAVTGMALHTPPSTGSHPARSGHEATPTDAVPGLVWRSGTATLRLTDLPCPSEDLARVLDTEGVTRPRAYEVTQGRERSSGCWTKDVSGDVVTMEPGREIGQIPIDWFRSEAGG